MKRAAIILSLLITATPMQPLAAQGPVVVEGGSQAQVASVEWAIDRFQTAGLELPLLVINVHDSVSGCEGHDGLYTPKSGTDRIDICTDAVFIILHELGHAWEHRFGSDEARTHLMDVMGIEAWGGQDVEYRSRGEEISASLIAWALIERPLTESEVRTSADRLAMFEAFTGVPSTRVTN